MENGDRQWLEAKFEGLEAKIVAMGERMTDANSHLSKDVDRLRADIDQLFNRMREADTEIQVLKDNKESGKDNRGTIISVISVLIAAAAVVVVLI